MHTSLARCGSVPLGASALRRYPSVQAVHISTVHGSCRRTFYTPAPANNPSPSPRSHVDAHQKKRRESHASTAASGMSGKPIAGTSQPLSDNKYASMVRQHEELSEQGKHTDGEMHMFGIYMSFIFFSAALALLQFAPQLHPTLTSAQYVEYEPPREGTAPIVGGGGSGVPPPSPLQSQ